MPIFEAGSTRPSTPGTFLFPFPSVDWFAQCVMGALRELTYKNNWVGSSQEDIDYATLQANKIMFEYRILNHNPFPPGLILPWGGQVAASGYLLCDGTSYLAEDYPELFAQIGYYFGGSGDNFNVPNLLNRFPFGTDGFEQPGGTGGDATVTLTVDEMPSHSHTDLGHTHTYQPPGGTILAVAPGEAPVALPNFIPSITGSGNANLTNTGGDGSHNNIPPYQKVTYMIYAGRENA